MSNTSGDRPVGAVAVLRDWEDALAEYILPDT
jgi:hypothetical protein